MAPCVGQPPFTRRCSSVTLICCYALCYALCWQATAALDNGVGQRPGMGWNWDYCTNCAPGVSAKERSPLSGEVFVRHIARFLNASGLQAKGYKYVNTDSFWGLPNRSASGDLQPDPVLWPSGMDTTVAELHSMNLGFGLYGDRGTHECNGKRPGNLGFETQDADFFARMNIDWFKQDSCAVPHANNSEVDALKEYSKMSAALLSATSKSGRRPIWFALCGWQPWYATPNAQADYLGGRSIANSWRIGPDTGSGWHAIMENVKNALPLTDNVTGPTSNGGGWNDLSLLLNPGMGQGDAKMTPARTRSQFSLYCVMGANLFMTGNLSIVDPFVLETWGNAGAININQDPLGLPHRVLPIDNSSSIDAAASTSTTAAAVPSGSTHGDVPDPRAVTMTECGGEPSRQAWVWGANGFVRNPSSGQCLNVKACETSVIMDTCHPTGPACDTAPRAPAANEVFEPPRNGVGPILIKLHNRTLCLTAAADKSVSVRPCAGNNDVQQRWRFDSGTQHITRADDGSCLTASGPSPPPNSSTATGLMLGRPLHDGRWGIIMLNNGDTETTITCGMACFAAMGLSEPPRGAQLTDVWSRGELGVVNHSISLVVPPNGASRLIVMGKTAATTTKTDDDASAPLP